MTPAAASDALRLLDFYRASELHGGLLLGRLAQQVRDPELILRLTRHAAEEVLHAQLWAETIVAVGGSPRRTTDSYQRRYAEVLAPPGSVLDVLVLTQVFERTVYRHFLAHRRRPGTHPAIVATLTRMLEDEKDHLTWVKHWLDAQPAARREHAAQLMAHYAAVDAQVFACIVRDYAWERAA